MGAVDREVVFIPCSLSGIVCFCVFISPCTLRLLWLGVYVAFRGRAKFEERRPKVNFWEGKTLYRPKIST